MHEHEMTCCAELQMARGRVRALRAEGERAEARVEELEAEQRNAQKRIQQLERQVAALIAALSEDRSPFVVMNLSSHALLLLPGHHVRQRRDSGLVGVPWIQGALRALVDPRLEVDGIVGPATRTAVRAFQAAQGLPSDGHVGERTRAALQRELQARGLGDDS